MDAYEELLANNAAYADAFADSSLGAAPVRKVVVVTCMDARIDAHKILGLEPGDAHVLRNAGGALTGDVIRSLLISSILGTEQVAVIHHTDCKMRAFTEEELKARAAEKVGAAPPFDLGAMGELEQGLRDSVATITTSPHLRFANVKGFVYDVRTGLVTEVSG